MIEKSDKYLCWFSECEKYRYAWIDSWSMGLDLVVIGLNPSTADETKMDPTVSKCRYWAEKWGYGRLIMLNAFAYRSTDPSRLYEVDDPSGPENDRVIDNFVYQITTGRILLAWGNHARSLNNRSEEVLKIVNDYSWICYCLNENKNGEPTHPLYQKMSIMPKPYSFSTKSY